MQNESRKLAYIAKDTKTYMNLEEARFKFSEKGDTNILFIIIPKHLRSNLTERMQETVKRDLWDEIVWINSYSNSVVDGEAEKRKKSAIYKFYWDVREFLYNYLDRRKLDAVAKKYEPCSLVFSAHKNTQEHLAAKLKPKELFLVDSGHRIFKRINKNGYIDYSRWFIAYSRFTRYMYWATGLKVFDRSRTSLFTVYADEIETKHRVEKNNYDYQSHLLNSKEIGDEVVWISTPIYTMAEGVEIEDYVSYIQAYMNHLEIDSGNMIYIPHPGKQTDTEIDYISKRLGCKIDDRDTPVEFKLANYGTLPKICISPFSSALVNVYTASGGKIRVISAWHYEFNYFEMWLNWRKDVEKNPELEIEFIELETSVPLFRIKQTLDKKHPPYETFSDWDKETLN